MNIKREDIKNNYVMKRYYKRAVLVFGYADH